MDAERWWSTWAPLWDLIEDRHFGTRPTESLIGQIRSDVLIIGAGQGLIVRYLAARGYHAVGLDINHSMVRISKEKHNLDMVEGDALHLPFKDQLFNTVVISSGVVDYGADKAAITAFIREAIRVCLRGGKIFIAFYRIPVSIEKIYKKIGVIDFDDVYHMKRIFEINEIAEKNPVRCATPIQKWTGKGMARVYFEWAIVGLTQPREFMAERKWINNIFKAGKEMGLTKQALIDSVPDTLPYRTKSSIEKLLGGIEIDYKEITEFDDCTVVTIDR
jgi:ubiquinone/menaquinone biosynthesis C-methylase UbiE